METRSNNILIGAFILAGLLLGVAATLWLSRTGDAGAKKQFYVVFMGSVQGLAPKAPVLFNGLRVGEVDEITLNPGNPTEIRTRITVEARTPVRRDTGARLTFQGLTGVAAVELSGGTEAAGDLVPGPDGVPPAMFTDRAAAANLFEGGQDTLGRINAVVGRLDALIVANQASINASIRNVQTFTDALAANSQAVSTLLADASTAARRIADLSARLEAVAEAVDPRKVGEIVDGAASVVSAVAAQREDIRTLIADASRAARNVAEAAERLAPSLRRAEDILTAVDPAAIGRIVAGAERSVAGIERFSTAVGAQAERIPRLAEDATEAMASLRRATGAFESLAGSACAPVRAERAASWTSSSRPRDRSARPRTTSIVASPRYRPTCPASPALACAICRT
jgi:phospholipid/cholesterol/gamma-HCH transport system substrate-binding protein